MNTMTDERLSLAKNRIMECKEEKGMMAYQPFFTSLSGFLCDVLAYEEKIRRKDFFANAELSLLKKEQEKLFAPLLSDNYENSYVNPEFCVKSFGDPLGKLLSFLYYEETQILPFVYEKKAEEVLIRLELFLEIYGLFEDETDPGKLAKSVKDALYWYVSDYSMDSTMERMKEQFAPDEQPAYDIVQNADLCKPSYLFSYGEYISENEIMLTNFLAGLPAEKISLMADTFTEGFRKGFLAAGKDISIKKTVNIRYPIGFERVVKIAVANFEKMGLKPVLYRAYGDIFRKRGMVKIGYVSSSVNRQAEYDHREDLSLFLDGHLVTRKLEGLKASCEELKKELRDFAGPACMETFGEKEFLPKENEFAATFDEEGRKAYVEYQAKASSMLNSYIHMEERSFTIIAFPIPEIGEQFPEIFDETIKINTLEYEKYQKIQTILIDTLNKAECVHILGKDGNETDLTVELCKLANPATQAKFENCVADVNIPVGEVFTSPVLEGTNGLLHVKKVYINGLKYENLRIRVEDGITTGGSTSNLPKTAVEENIMYHHEFLPMGEFAIGTNTTAYSIACRYNLFEKLPILIAEKTGPHFAFGDTCYSEEEEVIYKNPDGKEVVAKENTYSMKRFTEPEKAYFHCHTDITIPYEEIGVIEAVLDGGKRVPLLKDGRFVLPGTEELNIPLDEI